MRKKTVEKKPGIPKLPVPGIQETLPAVTQTPVEPDEPAPKKKEPAPPKKNEPKRLPMVNQDEPAPEK